MEPPIQTEYFRSGGAIILILIVDGANAVISFCIRSAIPKNNQILIEWTQHKHLDAINLDTL